MGELCSMWYVVSSGGGGAQSGEGGQAHPAVRRQRAAQTHTRQISATERQQRHKNKPYGREGAHISVTTGTVRPGGSMKTSSVKRLVLVLEYSLLVNCYRSA